MVTQNLVFNYYFMERKCYCLFIHFVKILILVLC